MRTKKNEEPFNIPKAELKSIHKEYDFSEVDKYMEYDDKTLDYINAFNQLDTADKIIMELYAEFQSQRKVADILKVSRTTVIKELNRIREKINTNL